MTTIQRGQCMLLFFCISAKSKKRVLRSFICLPTKEQGLSQVCFGTKALHRCTQSHGTIQHLNRAYFGNMLQLIQKRTIFSFSIQISGSGKLSRLTHCYYLISTKKLVVLYTNINLDYILCSQDNNCTNVIGGKSNVASQPTVPPSHDSNTYSSLGAKNNAMAPQDDKHYSPLLHKTRTEQLQSVPPNNGQDIGGQYGKSVYLFHLHSCRYFYMVCGC